MCIRDRLNPEKLKTAKEDMIILHPLPRVNEITRAVDNDPRAAYFRQVENGKFVRMALIYTLLRWADENRPFERTPVFSERYVVNEYELSLIHIWLKIAPLKSESGFAAIARRLPPIRCVPRAGNTDGAMKAEQCGYPRSQSLRRGGDLGAGPVCKHGGRP